MRAVPTVAELRSVAMSVADAAVQLCDELSELARLSELLEAPLSTSSRHVVDLELRQVRLRLDQLVLGCQAHRLTRQVAATVVS